MEDPERAPPLTAIGVLSGTSSDGPKYARRREAVRQTWAGSPPAGVEVEFVLRCGGLPSDAPERLENRVLCTRVAASEGRRRGPILALMAWLDHAPRAYPDATFIGKASLGR